jgi:hypothetical protein
VAFATAVCVTCAAVSAQDRDVPNIPKPRRAAIRLGMPGAEIRKSLGTPQAYRESNPTRDFPSSAVAVLPPSRDYFDVYEIETSLNTYELWINYAMDDSESRLHPVPRVIAMHFELDKRIGINDVGKVLDDIPEVAALCGAECTVAGEKEHSSIGGDHLYLHPSTVTPAEMAEAELIGSIFGKYPAEQFPFGTRKPTVTVIYERGTITQVMLGDDSINREGRVQTTWKPLRSAN